MTDHSLLEPAVMRDTFPDVLNGDGRIHYVGQCSCRGCGSTALNVTYAAASRDLKSRGWVKMDRRWFCSTCAPIYDQARNGVLHA